MKRGIMRILVVNDDGIQASGIQKLAELVSTLGEVWVVAPDNQCSAMSHRITVHGDLLVKKEKFPVEGVHAYSVSGTPADCVKVALLHILPEKPDVIFSGINSGCNAGIDLVYSGTVGAAMEGILNGIPAIAFSNQDDSSYKVAETYLLEITKELLAEKINANEIWNVNFPVCPLENVKGILHDRVPAQTQFYLDNYEKTELEDGCFRLSAMGIPIKEGADGTDIKAVLEGYISIGKVRNAVKTAD